jgi:squalene-hopene/tetraprenyl-beta-curcumene cyclase
MLQPTRSTRSSRPSRRASARPEASAPTAARLDACLTRGVEALTASQSRTGAWKSDPDMGPIGLALTALVEHWFGRLAADDAKRFAVSLVRAQREDGGFEIHPHAEESSLGATATCRAALRACGVSDEHRAVRRAETRIAAMGGYSAVRARLLSHGEPAAMFCAMVGLLPGDALPPLSPDMAALPWSERMLDGRVHAGVPVVIYACAAVRDRLAPMSVLPSMLRGPTRALARTRLASFIGQFQCDDGSWNRMVFSTVFSAVALSGVGLDAGDPMVRRALDWLETRKQRRGKGVFVSVFDGEVWETAFALDALAACGVPRGAEAIARGVAYLERAQCSEPQPRVNQPSVGAPRIGGWAYQLGNHTMPDCDDSGVVLAALGRCRPDAGGAEPVARGVAWLAGMQNPCGGWGSYVHGLPDKKPGQPLFVEPTSFARWERWQESLGRLPVELGDPAVADVCGRVLWGLGACGVAPESDIVRRAVAFLEKEQAPSGAWFGLWNPAYVSGTSFALLGLATVGADLDAAWVRRGIAWLLSAQHADGGFGETPRSYTDPSSIARTASMPPLTGIALRALSELLARGAGTPAVRAAADRAASYLVRTQREDGAWSDEGYLFTIVPPTFYTWGHHRLYYPLFGLGRYREATRSKAATRSARSARGGAR